MNMNTINQALTSYKALLDEELYKRLELFKGIWEIQDRFRIKAAVESEHSIPDIEEAEKWYWQEKPLLELAPASVDKDVLVAALEELAGYLVDNAGFDKDQEEALRALDWRVVVDETDVSLLGRDPFAYAEVFCAQAQEQSGSVIKPEISHIVLGLAMRPVLEPAASVYLATLKDAVKKGGIHHDKPLSCPVCGGRATVALVGDTPSIQGVGRLLYCGACSAEWEFERIRCGRCGTRNQGHLHYYHIGGDDAHRLHVCDECGEYLRTVFQDDLDAPLSFEVEDLVMVPLDMIASDPQFKQKTVKE